MAFRVYLLPIEESVLPNGKTLRGPKYFSYKGDPDPPALLDGILWDWYDFGLEPTGLLAVDLTAAQHALLAGQPDVTAIPANLDNTLGANLATVQAALESLHIPADGLVAGATYRQVIRGTVAIFQVAAIFNVRTGGGRLFPAGITLATQLSDLSAGVRAQLQVAAEQYDIDYAGLTLASTLRDVLKKIATRQTPVSLLGATI